jgi:amidohydrolase
LKARICKSVGDLEKTLLAVSHSIHARPELSFQEHHASALLCDTLRAEGLDVEGGAYGLETAFEANLGSGDGPCVAILAEYDALPGIGHACGHNLIATSALGAVLALERLGAELPGRIRLLGTPAEETGGGKELMARKGALDGVDVALMVHPSSVNLVTMPCIAFAEINVRYTGRAAHASAMPERGINALDAIVTAYQALGALRQHIGFKERIHGIITDGGQAPNVVPEHAAGCFYVRAASREELEVLKGRAMACFEAGARSNSVASSLRSRRSRRALPAARTWET